MAELVCLIPAVGLAPTMHVRGKRLLILRTSWSPTKPQGANRHSGIDEIVARRPLCSRALNKAQRIEKMFSQTVQASSLGAILPHVGHRLEQRINSFADAIGDHAKLRGGGVLANALVLPNAAVVIAGTHCRAPLLEPEVAEIAGLTGMDVVLMRFDVDKGVSFDVLMSQPMRSFRGYVEGCRPSQGVWLRPADDDGAWLSVSVTGISIRHCPADGAPGRAADVGDMVAVPCMGEV